MSIKHAAATAAVLAAMATGSLAQQVAQPKLIVAIAVDQFRYDYTTRFRSHYKGGLDRMLREGAVFVDAHQDHFPTVTAPGHTTILTGSTPSTSGIISNDWYSREKGRVITSVEDEATRLTGLEGDKVGSSPHNLVVSTLVDEIKIANGGASKAIGISMKDRAAILPAGRMADAAYWVDSASGTVVSSTWYAKELPEWVKKFNSEKPAQQWLGATWTPLDGGKPFLTLSKTADKEYFSKFGLTPYANEMLEQLAERTLVNEKLGQHDGVDVLTVSFSANDHLGHSVGPDAPEVADMSVQTDRTIGKLLDAAAKAAGGEKNLIVVFTADHGVSPVPEVNAARRMPGERVDKAAYLKSITDALVKQFGEGNWILGTSEAGFYFNEDLIREKKLKHSAVEDAAAAAALEQPYVARAYTRTQLLKHEAAADQIDLYVARSFFADRSPDVIVILKPYVLFGKSGTSHGSPYDYDTHVPLIYWGGSIAPGVYAQRVGVSDVAPTLAAVLAVETPSGNVGKVLDQVAKPYLQARQRPTGGTGK